MKTTKLLASFAMTTAIAVSTTCLTMPAANAATVNQVKVVSNAYLVSKPTTGSSRIKLERAGTVLTVVPGGNSFWWHVKDNTGRYGYITSNKRWTSPVSGSTQRNVTTVRTTQTTTTSQTTSTQLPPGVTFDSSVNALAPLHASYQTKLNAILQVSESKLGTPYVWGHNEDRGQYGFDCSNFTAYVYHHALGYKMSGSSLTQYSSVGWRVPLSSMRPGDLLVFNNGGHVGIYIGNGQMIQEGGGLGKVGYLKVSPGSYWYNHISAVKRMF